MENQIIAAALDLFLKLGFKSVTMELIAREAGISKKTIYIFFKNKEVLVGRCVSVIQRSFIDNIALILQQNYNAVEESFHLRQIYKQMFKHESHMVSNELKKNYPEIHRNLIAGELSEFDRIFRLNIQKGMAQEFYKKELNVDYYKFFYATLVFNLGGGDISEKQLEKLELEVLEYHTRAIATPKGILELEKQLRIFSTAGL